MADEEKEKAEKLAAAKKRFEQLKKEQQKKGKKTGGNKKKDDKSKAEDATAATEEPSESTTAIDHEKADEVEDAASQAEPTSLPLQSKQRSESFRQGALSPGGEVEGVYKKQVARIEELERENRAFKEQQEEGAAQLAKAEEELESLRAGSEDVAELRSKAKEAERLSTELAGVQRQLAQSQQQLKSKDRRTSAGGADSSEQLASKTSTIENLELELSNLRTQLNSLQSTFSERDASIRDAEEKLQAAQTVTESYKSELDQLKLSMSGFASDETSAANEDPEALTKRISVLESDIRTANSNLDVAAQRASSLEQKIETLTKLHRDNTSSNAAKDKELNDLRTQLRRRERGSHVRDASDFELGEEETETGALQARIRALEAENFDLRRGVWRDKRAELQPGMEDGSTSPGYEDVDLDGNGNGPYGSLGRPSLQGQKHSTFQDVITSGISAFTGRARDVAARPAQHERKASLGLLSDDGDGFDEEAFRLAQEEEAKRRIERVKEVKRGLDRWRGWRVDLVEERGKYSRAEMGPVFEV